MSMVTDFHSHVLPAIDDGSASLEESLALLEREAAHGISHVVATPHFYARYDQPETFFRRRNQAEELLRKELERRPHLPQLSVGAEVHFFRGISQSDVIDKLTIDGSPYVMVEMPDSKWTESMYQELEDLHRYRGLTPIIAHVDRYIAPFHTHGIPERLAQMPVLVQANASFFLGSGKSLALKMLRKGQIQLLGSDCHNLKERPPRLGEAVSVILKKLGQDTIEQICAQEQAVFGLRK